MKCQDCAYGNVCTSSNREECICYNSSEMKCMKDDLTVIAQVIMKSQHLKQHIFSLKRAYKCYCDLKCNATNDFERGFYARKADSVLCVLNDLGFRHLVRL